MGPADNALGLPPDDVLDPFGAMLDAAADYLTTPDRWLFFESWIFSKCISLFSRKLQRDRALTDQMAKPWVSIPGVFKVLIAFGK